MSLRPAVADPPAGLFLRPEPPRGRFRAMLEIAIVVLMVAAAFLTHRWRKP